MSVAEAPLSLLLNGLLLSTSDGTWLMRLSFEALVVAICGMVTLFLLNYVFIGFL